ncbi:HupE/UreJ family protein [Flavobacterium sp.]|uniref:HupE/UreJ family protein n=1 Tax=Flavobacterium sp. TaxID=239 RepID=UPI0025DD484F|nr:HupE/UreJ family protein [Flavobacterium sp.]
MSDFWLYFNIGLKHLFNFRAYQDVLFLIALTVPYEFNAWRRLLILVSLFTAGHILALLLAVFNILLVKVAIVNFLIPTIIFIVAFYNILNTGKASKKAATTPIAVVTTIFGIIHGLGYASYFNSLVPKKATDKLLSLFEAALGFQISQFLLIIIALLLAYVVQTLFKFTKSDWILIVSAFTIGIIIPIVIRTEIWWK